MNELKAVLEQNIETAYDFFSNSEGITLSRPQGTYVVVPDFEDWCRIYGKTLDELLEDGVRYGILWRDGRQFHIPYGIRMSLGLPTAKLKEALNRLGEYVL